MIVVFQLVSILHNRKILGHCMIALEWKHWQKESSILYEK